MKKLVIKKPTTVKQISWFIFLYLGSLLVFGLIHEVIQLLINFLKEIGQ
ncbi:MAG: hypothetical protein ACK5Z5_01085 [Neisseriaceae bacterium]